MKLLSDRERNLLESLAKSRSVKDAASFIRSSYDPAVRDEKMTTDAAYSILYRVRKKYLDARGFATTIRAYRKKSELLKKVLTPTVKEAEV